MKVTSKVTPPKPATLDTVTLEMSARDAFLLMALVGNVTGNKLMDIVNGSSTLRSDLYPKSISHNVTTNDILFLGDTYHSLKGIFLDAKEQGVE